MNFFFYSLIAIIFRAFIAKARKRDQFLTIYMSLIILCICLRMIFRRRVFIMASLPDHWHNSFSLRFFFLSSTTTKKKNEEKKKMHEPSTEGRARIRAPIPFDRYQKKGWWRVSNENLEYMLLLCLFFFSWHDFDQYFYWTDYRLKTIDTMSFVFQNHYW